MKTRMIPTVLLLGLCLPTFAQGQSAEKAAASLKWTPADVAMYSARLRLGEQWEAIAKSNAWKKLMDLPAVKDALAKAYEPGSPLNDKETKDALDLVGELLSREVVSLAGDSMTDLLVLLQELQGASQGARAFGGLQGGDPSLAQARGLVTTLQEQRKRIRMPDLILGFRLENADRAKAVRKQLGDMLAGAVEAVPELKGRVKTEQVEGADWMTLTLDGKMVPWEDIPLNALEEHPGEFKPLLDHLQALKLVVGIGTYEDFLLLTVGDSTAMIKQLGKGAKLADADELKPLAKFADRKVTSIDYVSKKTNATLLPTKEDLDGMVEYFSAMLELADLTKEQREQAKKDIALLIKDLWVIPEPGGSASFSFLTDRGWETYSHDWTRYPNQTQPKPLTLFEHIGGNPLVAFLSQSPTVAEDYKTLVKWIKVADGYIESVFLPRLGPNERVAAAQALQVFRPLFQDLDDATRKFWLPALQGGQSALVLDGRLRSKQWVKALPPTPKPMPILEPALVLGVSDPDLLQKGMGEYRKIINKMIAAGVLLSGGQAQPPEIPPANLRKVGDVTVYSYAIAEMLGLDAQLAPSAAVGPKAAAFGFSEATTARLAKATPFKGEGPLARSDRPLISASYIDCEGLVRVVQPWVEFGVDWYLADYFRVAVQPEENKFRDNVLAQVRTVMDVLTVVRRSESATYLEGGAVVTHSETVVRDLEK